MQSERAATQKSAPGGELVDGWRQVGSVDFATGAVDDAPPTQRDPRQSNHEASDTDTIRIGLLLPLSGPSGLLGPSGRNCAELAANEINKRGGLLGKRVQVIVADGGMSFEASAREGLRLIEEDGAAALIGTHPSGVREVLAPRIAGRVPYVYTPIFEGGDTAPGVFFLGETAPQQLGPVVPWLAETHAARRWFLIGNDYRWPRDAHWTARAMVDRTGGTVAGEILLPLGTEDFEEAIDAIAAARPDVVIAALVGSDAVIFHRAFARAGLSESIWRLGLLTEENTLLGVGADCSDRLLTVAGYFAALDTSENRTFVNRYLTRFGPHAPPLNSIGQSAYEGLIFLDEIARRAGSLTTQDLARVSDGLVFHGPRGTSRMVHRHLVKDMHLAAARGIEFTILKSFPQISATGEMPS